MKKIISFILCISIMTVSIMALSSCSVLDLIREGILMPNVKTDHTFENDTWLVMENRLINKIDSTIYRIKPNHDIVMVGADRIDYSRLIAYNYKFDESSFKQYALLEAYSEKYSEYVYYDCIITYDYDGKEIDRFYFGEPMTKDRVQAVYSNTEDFSFYVVNGYGFIQGRIGTIYAEDATFKGRVILNYVEDLYESRYGDGESYYIVEGLARPMGNEIWFCTSASDRRNIKNDVLISGIDGSEITAYDPKTKEFKPVFEYNKKRTQIIDFDENGAYILESNGRFGYVDFETKKISEICRFERIDFITVTDKYVYVEYRLDGEPYTCFAYEKGGSVVVNEPVTEKSVT